MKLLLILLCFWVEPAISVQQKSKAEVEQVKPVEINEGDIIIYESKDKLTSFPVRVKAFVLNEDGEDRVVVVRKDNTTAGFVVSLERLGWKDCFKLSDLETPKFRFEIGEQVHRRYDPMIIKDRKSLWGENLYLVKRKNPAFKYEEIMKESELSYRNIDQVISE